MITVIVKDKQVNEILEIVNDLRSQGLAQGRDFDFAYQPEEWDAFTGLVKPRLTVFKFHTEKYATLFSLKHTT